MSDDETPSIDKLFAEIERLRQARALLEEVWKALGPYFGPDNKLPSELENKMQRFFQFDDGE